MEIIGNRRKIFVDPGKNLKLQGLEKNLKLINVEPTFIPDYRVPEKQGSGWKHCLKINKQTDLFIRDLKVFKIFTKN